MPVDYMQQLSPQSIIADNLIFEITVDQDHVHWFHFIFSHCNLDLVYIRSDEILELEFGLPGWQRESQVFSEFDNGGFRHSTSYLWQNPTEARQQLGQGVVLGIIELILV